MIVKILIGSLVFLYVLSAAFMIHEYFIAPRGYEDKKGYHNGNEPLNK